MSIVRFLYLLVLVFVLFSFILVQSPLLADDKSNPPNGAKVEEGMKPADAEDKAQQVNEQSDMGKNVKESAVSEPVVKPQSQKKKVPVFWVLLPEK